MNKKIVLTTLFFLAGLLTLGAVCAHAQVVGPTVENMAENLGATAETGAGYSGITDPRLVAMTIIRSALTLVGIVFLVLTIYAGVMWMTASGNDEKIEKSKKILTAAVIGLAVVLSSWAITIFATYIITGGQRVNIPTNSDVKYGDESQGSSVNDF